MALIQFYIKTVMKNPILLLTTFTLGLLCAGKPAFSQEVIRQQSCSNDLMVRQADSLRELYSKDGYVLVREASMVMESEFEMPVIVPLNEGTLYQFVFIGEISSRLYEVRMYDWQEKMVIFRQHKWGDVDGNIISYTYVPNFSEFHMMKPVQVNKQKKKGLCGYVMMFKKVVEK
jgi:hypothetical protein